MGQGGAAFEDALERGFNDNSDSREGGIDPGEATKGEEEGEVEGCEDQEGEGNREE